MDSLKIASRTEYLLQKHIKSHSMWWFKIYHAQNGLSILLLKVNSDIFNKGFIILSIMITIRISVYFGAVEAQMSSTYILNGRSDDSRACRYRSN